MRVLGVEVSATFWERYWSKVNVVDDATSCWEWTASGARGYGQIGAGSHDGPSLKAHRVSYELHHGPIPDGLVVCHACDNRGCVRPDHLWLGTQRENLLDMRAKGRNNDVGSPGPRPLHEVCKRGHPLIATNIYRSGRNRACRRCALDRTAKRQGRMVGELVVCPRCDKELEAGAHWHKCVPLGASA